ncbi:MAG: FmdB family zinc ribbon protein [Armatimonadota bacterium]
MPTYGYQCTKCNHTFEVFQKITDDPLTKCEQCEGELKKLLYPVGIVFKGSGFHVNDYKSSSSPQPEVKEAEPVKEPVKETAKEPAASVEPSK